MVRSVPVGTRGLTVVKAQFTIERIRSTAVPDQIVLFQMIVEGKSVQFNDCTISQFVTFKASIGEGFNIFNVGAFDGEFKERTSLARGVRIGKDKLRAIENGWTSFSVENVGFSSNAGGVDLLADKDGDYQKKNRRKGGFEAFHGLMGVVGRKES